MSDKSKKGRPQEEPKPKTPEVPRCSKCRQPVLRCTCKDNELKK